MSKKGFTLIEILVSVTLFLVVMTIAMGAILGAINANRKTHSLNAVMDNLNSTLESMAREIRFGTAYHCVLSASDNSPFTNPQDCPSGYSEISFLSNSGVQVVYNLSGTSIVKSTDGGATYIPITSPDVTITNVTFYVFGSSLADNLQPRIVMKVQGSSGQKTGTISSFTVQTFISQRQLDKP